MKLKNFRRVAALGMAVGMTAVLAACGNTADTASSEAATVAGRAPAAGQRL